MYASLRAMDVVAELDGRPLVVQTDHRDEREIEAEPELSSLLAMTRVLNALAWLDAEHDGVGVVRYSLHGRATAALREALTAVGGWLSEGGRAPEWLGAGTPDRVSRLADAAFSALASRVLARYGTADPMDGVRRLEADTLAAPLDRTDDAAFYRRVLELAAVAGEWIRTRAGGGWEHHPKGPIPFAFRMGQGAVVFPTNRAERFAAGSGRETLVELLSAVEDVLRQGTGRVMPSLRARDQLPLDRVVWSPVLATGPDELPVVVYGEDRQATFAVLDASSVDRGIDALAAEALDNLAREEVALERVEVEGLVLAVAGGAFYAAEKLLDPVFVARIHEMLGGDALAVGVPSRGLLLATRSDQSADRIGWFAALVRQRHAEADDQRICAAVLLVDQGVVSGYVGPRPVTAES